MIPSGWYFCAESSEIKPGKIVTKSLFGERVILWRTESGVITISRSICPHLGSDLSKLGKVSGEHLQCFSHHYAYNTAGDCVATKFNELPTCHKKILQCYPVRESNGFILAWYDAKNKEPTWNIPDDIFMLHSKDYIRSNFVFEVDLETINEDNFDVGHLYTWHHVYDVNTTPVIRNNHTISISHYFKRHSILFSKPLRPPFDIFSKEINSRYSSTLYGHGLTNSFIDIYNLDIHLQDLIWCTPINAKRTLYTTFLRLLKNDSKQSLAKRWMNAFIFNFCLLRLRKEHGHEGHGFWERKSKIEHPMLTATEYKLIGPYREWCKQFHIN